MAADYRARSLTGAWVTCLAGLVLQLATFAEAGVPAWAGEDRWTPSQGPPGLVYTVALDPQTPGVLYIGTSTAGVFKSSDAGQSWTSANQGLGARAVFSLALDPSRPAILYAGTNQGVYRSLDGAASWSPSSTGILFTFGTAYVYSLVIDSGQPSTLYAGTLLGVFKSQDGGQSWQEKNTGMRVRIRPSVEALALDPSNSNVLYAGASYEGLGSSIYKSQDGGDTWVPLTVGLYASLVSSLAVDPGDSRRVLAGTRGQGVFASGDGGMTWQPVGQGALETQIAALALGGSPKMTYAAGMHRGFYRSADEGASWEEVGEGIGERRPTALALDPHSQSVLWLTAAGGLYRSSDSGSHWSASGDGVASAQVVAVLPHPSNPDIIHAGAWAGGLYRSANGGASWQAAPLGVGIPTALALDPSDPNLVYAGMFYLTGARQTGLYLSRDSGETWQAVPIFRGRSVAAIVAASGRAYLGSDAGVWASEDSGRSWVQSGAGLPLQGQVSLLALDPRDPSRAYLALEVAPRDLYWSKDSGKTWSRLHSFTQPPLILAPSPTSPGLMYAATYTAILSSSDGGENWQEMPFIGLGPTLSLAPHPLAPRTLYLGTTLGAYRSLDGGRTWRALGPETEAVTALAVSAAEPRRIYGGTWGGGLWTYTAVPSLVVQPRSLAFLTEPGLPLPGPALLALRDESGGSFGWSAQATPPGAWLSLSPSAGASLPATAALSLNTVGLAPGTHQGAVTITSTMAGTRNSPRQVPVTLSLAPLWRSYLPWLGHGLSGW